MGPILEMKRFAALALLALALAGCDGANTSGTSPYEGLDIFEVLALREENAQFDVTQISAAQGQALRQVLEADGQPILLVQYPRFKYLQLMAPFGQNGGVTTWASEKFQAVSMRGGMVVATRGFLNDLMSANVPDGARIAAGTGTTNRLHVFLNGADQEVRQEFSCTLATVGRESVAVLGRAYATRKVVESCAGAAGSFQNSYWLDETGRIRQSWQAVGPEMEQIFLQMVVDPTG